jgi:hypothetical protein
MGAMGLKAIFGAALACAGLAVGAVAGPWAEPGDARLKSDIELLASAGVIDNITMQWPIPWAGVLGRLNAPSGLADQPDFIREAAARVNKTGQQQMQLGHAHVTVDFDAATDPAVVRGFDALGRQTIQGRVTYEYLWDTTSVHLAVGTKSRDKRDRQALVLDESYIAQRIDNVVVYAGLKSHWWGPGWMSALSLSSNARPMPQIGIARTETTGFKSPWLSWLGPWQLEAFGGVLTGPRVDGNTGFIGVRFAFSPIKNLEIGLSRTTELCGENHPCKPLDYFNPMNDPTHVNTTNDEATIDIKYGAAFANWAYEIYVQAMNEDTNPLIHSGSSHLAGATLWAPFDTAWGGVTGRLTVEYADSYATNDLWGGSFMHGVAYNNGGYADGMRYRDRALGFSLDSDSRLFSLAASVTDANANNLSFTYHHAEISSPQLAAVGYPWTNVVSQQPVTINIGEVHLIVPVDFSAYHAKIDLVGRVQDDQPWPKHGATAALELALTFGL